MTNNCIFDQIKYNMMSDLLQLVHGIALLFDQVRTVDAENVLIIFSCFHDFGRSFIYYIKLNNIKNTWERTK